MPGIAWIELRSTGDALGAAFHGIAAAPPLTPLASQVDSAASAVRAATQRLVAIVPPTHYAAAQTDLLFALDQLASELSGLSAQIQSRELCAAPPVIATLSTLPGADALRHAAAALGPAGADLTAAPPAAQPLPDRRMKNGIVLRDPGSGHGEFTVENGTGHDAVVTLSRDGRAVGSFFVARGETAQLNGIRDGMYDVFFTTGADWDGAAFTRSCAFERFDETVTFATGHTKREITYTTYSATLQPIPSGNIRTVEVQPESFPR